MEFYSNIYRYYDDVFPLNKSQISFVNSCINEKLGNGKLLDIGCGTGRLPIALFDYFKNISAIDINSEMLGIAKTNAGDKNIDFYNIGMLDIHDHFPAGTFDMVLCFGNTVVHLCSFEEIELFFTQVKSLLNKGGKFLFQIINYDKILDNNLKGLPTIENEEVKFERNYELDEKKLINFSTNLSIKKTGEVIRSTVKLYPVRKKQVEKALRNAGFDTIYSYSSFNKIKYDSSKLPLVFECN